MQSALRYHSNVLCDTARLAGFGPLEMCRREFGVPITGSFLTKHLARLQRELARVT